MLGILHTLSTVLGIVSFVFFIIVLVNFFKAGKVGLGILCILTMFVCGVGGLITFISGWMNADELGIKKIMVNWTICVVLDLATIALLLMLGGIQAITTFEVSATSGLLF